MKIDFQLCQWFFVTWYLNQKSPTRSALLQTFGRHQCTVESAFDVFATSKPRAHYSPLRDAAWKLVFTSDQLRVWSRHQSRWLIGLVCPLSCGLYRAEQSECDLALPTPLRHFTCCLDCWAERVSNFCNSWDQHLKNGSSWSTVLVWLV